MMSILTELKLNTSYTQRAARRAMKDNYGALEYLRDFRRKIVRDLNKDEDNSPRIIKHPFDERRGLITTIIKEMQWEIDHILLTKREMEPLIRSTIARWLIKQRVVTEERTQKQVNKRKILFPYLLDRVKKEIEENNYPYSIVEFPKLIEDPNYCYNKMIPFLTGVKEERFIEVHTKFANPNFIHFR